MQRDVRVESIQRLDSDDGKAVSGIVTVRNLGATRRTVQVSVNWLNDSGGSLGPNSVSSQSLTLAPGESSVLRFEGPPGSRDFKVVLGYAAK